MEAFKEDKNRHIEYSGLPNLPRLIFEDQEENDTYYTDTIPPILSCTDAIVTETTSSDPSLIRSTMYKIPISEYALVECGIPLSFILTPFNEKSNVTLLNNVDKCLSCNTYVSKLTRQEGNLFRCSICNKPISITNQNALYNSTYDIVQSEIAPRKPIFTFVVDLNTGILGKQALKALEALFDSEDFLSYYDQYVVIALSGSTIVTFEQQNNSIGVLKMLGDSAPKLSKNVILNTHQKHFTKEIFTFLNQLKIENGEPVKEQVYLRMLQDLSRIFPVNTMLFSNTNSLFNYEAYLETNKNICINLFTLCNKKENTLSRLAFYSSGNVFIYKQNDIDCFIDLLKVATSKIVFNTNINLRVSSNLVKTDVIAPTLNTSLGLLTINALNNVTTIMYNLSLSEPSTETKHIQAEIKYTDIDGYRKIRILNLELGVDKNIYPSLCFDTIFAAFVKMKLDEDINFADKLARILVTYISKKVSKTEPNFIMPKTISPLPVLFQAYNKKLDMNARFIYTATVEQILKYFYPTMISLSSYDSDGKMTPTRLSNREISEGEIYILENSREILFYVANNVTCDLLNDIFKNYSILNGSISIDDFDHKKLLGKKCIEIFNNIFVKYSYKMKVTLVYAGQPLDVKVQSYMVEDNINGKGTYYDYVYELFNNVKSRLF